MGIDFNRQKPIGNYIIDFYNSKYRLAIEIDGSSHENKGSYDLQRDQELKSFGICSLHLDDRIIKRSLPALIDYIDSWIVKQIHLQTPPSDTSDDPC